jgi:hypothetical protein
MYDQEEPNTHKKPLAVLQSLVKVGVADVILADVEELQTSSIELVKHRAVGK